MSSVQLTTEDDDLDHARSLRREVEKALRTTSGAIPEDPRMLALYLQNLDGFERSALAKKRIVADKEVGNQQAVAAGLIAEMLRNPRSTMVGRGVRTEIPALDSDIAPTRVLEGELTGSNAGDTYEAFANRTKLVEEVGA